MKFLCLGYPDRCFSPRPDLAAGYAAPGEAMRAARVLAGSGQLSPGEASKFIRVTAGRAGVGGGPPPGSGPQPSACFASDRPDLHAALGAQVPQPRVNPYRFKPGGLACWVSRFWVISAHRSCGFPAGAHAEASV
jgi:hypothetical protein